MSQPWDTAGLNNDCGMSWASLFLCRYWYVCRTRILAPVSREGSATTSNFQMILNISQRNMSFVISRPYVISNKLCQEAEALFAASSSLGSK